MTKLERIQKHERGVRAGLRAFPQKQLDRLYKRITGGQLPGLEEGFGWRNGHYFTATGSDDDRVAEVGCLAGSAFKPSEWRALEESLAPDAPSGSATRSDHPLIVAAYTSFPAWLKLVGGEPRYNVTMGRYLVNGPAVEALAKLVKQEHRRRLRAKARAAA